MDFSFSPEQDQLRAQARSFLEKRFPAARLAEIATSRDGWDRASWPELARLGWTGASIAVPDASVAVNAPEATRARRSGAHPRAGNASATVEKYGPE